MTDPSGLTLSAEQLQPGVFVVLDLPWFKHPFALNSFRIESAQQVQMLRALGLKRYGWDPARSQTQAHPAPAGQAQQATPADAALPAEPMRPGAAEPPDCLADTDGSPAAQMAQALAHKQVQVAALQGWRQRVENLDRAFLKAQSVVKNLSRDMLNRPQQALSDTGALVDDMVAVFLDAPDATLQVLGERVGAEEVYLHSLNVTILSVMLARELGLSAADAKELGVGAMLHDIGLVDVPDKVLRKDPGTHSRAERGMRAQHIDYGLSIAVRAGVSLIAQSVIAQHHELADGSGYPKGLTQDQITLPARVVAVVNAYDNLCNPFDAAQALTPHEALSHLYAKRRDKFDVRVLQTLVRCLGVYPPGTVVQLDSQIMGLVVAVNPRKPLRPRVLVYDAQVAREDALVIDLETEPSLGITRALRAALLPPAVAHYLSPRRRVAYFFDTGGASGAGGL